MKRSKTLATTLIALSFFAGGCAARMKKPTVFVDKFNHIPADIPSQFPNRYEQFISGKELKEFNKLLTEAEQQKFIDKFWLDRDPDPTTPENERKDEVDGFIDDIANERFLSTPGVFGLSFRSNGGFRGDLAKVYLLHGEPDAMDMIESNSFTPMMLWVYGNLGNNSILYAFLFYQKGGSGSYRLFPQDSYRMDLCGAIKEIKRFKEFNAYDGGNQACPPDAEQVLWELQMASSKGGSIDGRIFAWALFNFSQDSSISQGAALQPPKSALERAKRSEAYVVGEAPKPIGVAGIDYLLASCEQCNSFIPGALDLGKEFKLTVRRGDIDWRIVGVDGKTESVLKIRLVVENVANPDRTPLVFERWATLGSFKNLIISNPSGQRIIPLLTTDEITRIPAGTYWVSVYVKNVTPGLMTKKYNAWAREFVR